MPATNSTVVISGTIARIEWERFHHATNAIIMLEDGRILRVHSQGLGASEQDLLVLTRDGDAIEVVIAGEPEPHVLRFNNQSISGSGAA
jgi:hypothetical protein